MASALDKLQNDLEEVNMLLEKTSRKRVRDALTAKQKQKQNKIETEIKNKMQQKSRKKPELLGNEKPASVCAPITTGYTVKISNYRWDQSDKFLKFYITLMGVHQVTTENVQVPFTERSFDLLKEKPSEAIETDPSEGLMNVLKKIYEDGDEI
ncbi:calcyclin-binding protein-like isoform X2 [Callospermophilus lateralis]|uniref:calcyclin-binding protein-like isoform X2 n=1 Tax=Callospermophilus lateralis TaxID=76772 RepID=UPI0040386A9C